MSVSGVQLTGVSFSAYNKDEVRRLSVKRIANPVTFDNMLHPTLGGLYDPALGPIDTQDRCTTCSLLGAHCPGHVGHIELPFPVYNPMFFMRMFQLLRATCRYCHHLTAPRAQLALVCAQLTLLDYGLMLQAKDMESIFDVAPTTTKEDGEEAEGEKAIKHSVADWEALIKARLEKILASENIDVNVTKPNFRAKTVQIETYRRSLVSTILKLCVSGKHQCPACGGIRRRLTQEHYARIFVAPLSHRDSEKMTLKKMKEECFIDEYQVSLADLQKGPNAAPTTTIDETSDSEDKPTTSNGTAPPQTKSSNDKSTTNDRYVMTPMEAHEHLKRLWANESSLLHHLFKELVLDCNSFQTHSSPDAFFVYVLPVSPSRFRPASKLGDKTFENPETTMLQKVLSDCKELSDTTAGLKVVERHTPEGARLMQRQYTAWGSLQLHVNLLMDSSLDPRNVGEASRGIRQTLERKEGLFRMHMMGKRVNYAARSVISPDPMIGTHEIGVPEVFALRLSFPEPVTTFNVDFLRNLVLNGPKIHPGATHIEDELGNMIELSADFHARKALADQLLTPHAGSTTVACKKVLRHIRSGDWVLVNRQPTLHKSSIMAHSVRVLRGERTLRLHYANCKTYNADFDGDEMNMHFPQNHIARAEAQNIANTDFQYCALDGSPLRGLIQDHIVAGFNLTMRDMFFDRDTYHHLVYASLRDQLDGRRIRTNPPCILKPTPLWSGKQVVTTMLQNITAGLYGLNLIAGAKVNNKWIKGHDGLEGEDVVMVRNGELLIGVLDKNQTGATANGLIHACYEIYGGRIASEVLSAFGRLFTAFLKFHSLSLGVDDILLTPPADAARRELIDAAVNAGHHSAAKFIDVDPDTMTRSTLNTILRREIEPIVRDPNRAGAYDSAMMRNSSKLQSAVINATVPSGLSKQFPSNVLQLIIQSGAKGSNVNATQISSLLGQQALEGRRVPVMVSGKTLPSFPPFDPSLRAGGMIFDRFLTGLKPQEFYFHCMAGREGLVDTAVKTSRSGYLQRCLVKHLEDLRIHYDLTVRDADGSIIQFLYGDDGMDVTKAKQLENFGLLGTNFHALLETLDSTSLAQAFPTEEHAEHGEQHLERALADLSLDPALSIYRPDRYFGSVSESLRRKLDAYIKKDPSHLFTVPGPNGLLTQHQLMQITHLKCVRTLSDAGENVGVLAAQAVGEPSTQMTLNTFHFAGRSDMNVTLGIPRLREIIMTASDKIKTPLMSVPLVPGLNPDVAEWLSGKLQRVTFADLLNNVEVEHKLADSHNTRCRLYTIRFNFIDPKEYTTRFALSSEALLDYVEKSLVQKVVQLIMKAADGASQRNIDNALESVSAAQASHAPRQSGGGSDSDAGEDEDSGAPDNNNNNQAEDSDDIASDREDAGTLVKDRNVERGAYDDGKDTDEEKSEDESNSNSEDENEDAEEGGAAKSNRAENGDTDPAVVFKASDQAAEKPEVSRKRRIDAVKAIHHSVHDYSFDPAGHWCTLVVSTSCETDRLLLVSLIETMAPKIVVRQTTGIKRCALSKSKEELPHPDTFEVQGINLTEMWKYLEYLDVNRLKSNDIWAILAVYGIEAARATMIRELRDVFQVYGIAVDHRHLSLITDFMTFEGEIRALNRIGMRSSVSPLHKMSFETSTDWLRQAALSGDHDSCQSHSSRLVVGRVVSGGTGGHTLLSSLDSFYDES